MRCTRSHFDSRDTENLQSTGSCNSSAAMKKTNLLLLGWWGVALVGCSLATGSPPTDALVGGKCVQAGASPEEGKCTSAMGSNSLIQKTASGYKDETLWEDENPKGDTEDNLFLEGGEDTEKREEADTEDHLLLEQQSGSSQGKDGKDTEEADTEDNLFLEGGEDTE